MEYPGNVGVNYNFLHHGAFLREPFLRSQQRDGTVGRHSPFCVPSGKLKPLNAVLQAFFGPRLAENGPVAEKFRSPISFRPPFAQISAGFFLAPYPSDDGPVNDIIRFPGAINQPVRCGVAPRNADLSAFGCESPDAGRMPSFVERPLDLPFPRSFYSSWKTTGLCEPEPTCIEDPSNNAGCVPPQPP